MSARWLVAPVGLPIVLTVATLALVAWNRGAVRGPTTLTQREAALSSSNDDNSAATLWLSWQSEPALREPWMGPDLLRDLGFDVSVDPAAADAGEYYRRVLPRAAFVAFELDGPAWQALLAAREREAGPDGPPRPGDPRSTGSRLVPVDAAREAATLATRYPNARTHLIAAATIGMRRHTEPGVEPYLAGWVMNVDPREMHVPRELAARLPPRDRRDEQPSFTVEIDYGRRFEPWVVGVN